MSERQTNERLRLWLERSGAGFRLRDAATGEVVRGELPGRALRLVREWAEIHRAELAANWERTQEPGQPLPIDPLP